MWLTFIVAFIVFLLVALALAISLLVSGKAIKGSCGGINCGLCKDGTTVCRKVAILKDRTKD